MKKFIIFTLTILSLALGLEAQDTLQIRKGLYIYGRCLDETATGLIPMPIEGHHVPLPFTFRTDGDTAIITWKAQVIRRDDLSEKVFPDPTPGAEKFTQHWELIRSNISDYKVRVKNRTEEVVLRLNPKKGKRVGHHYHRSGYWYSTSAPETVGGGVSYIKDGIYPRKMRLVMDQQSAGVILRWLNE